MAAPAPLARPRRHPVAHCPRCGQVRRVEQVAGNYRLAEHKRGLHRGLFGRCPGTGKRVAADQVGT